MSPRSDKLPPFARTSGGSGTGSPLLPPALGVGVLSTLLMLLARMSDGWGAEHYRAPEPAVFVVLLLGALAAPVVAMPLLIRAHRVLRPAWSRISWPVGFVLLWFACFALRESRYMGDWEPLLARIPMGPDWLLWGPVFWRAPLANGLQFLHWHAVDAMAGESVVWAWQFVLAGWGAAWLVASAWALREAVGPRPGLLLFLAVPTSGLVLLALGHLENYAIPMTFIAATMALSMRALRDERHRGWPAFLVWGAAVMAHPLCAVFAPSMLVLAWRRRSEWWALLLAGATVPALVHGAAKLAGTRGTMLSVRNVDGSALFLPPSLAFGGDRLLDLASVGMIVAPLWLAACVPALAFSLRDCAKGVRASLARDRRLPWCAMTIPSAAFYAFFIWNKMPMEIDWDLLAPALLPAFLGALSLAWRILPPGRRIFLIVALVAGSVPHTMLWIARNRTPDPKQQANIAAAMKAIAPYRDGSVPLVTRRELDAAFGTNP